MQQHRTTLEQKWDALVPYEDDYIDINDVVSDDPVEVNDLLTKQAQLPFAHKPQCPGHSGSKGIFSFHGRGISLGGASGHDLDPTVPQLVIDCAGIYAASRNTSSFVDASFCDKKYKILESLISSPPLLELHWRDMGTPPVGIKFWRKLWSLLPKGHVIICCHGGHGRTGTALACLALMGELGLTADKAIDTIRTTHCPKAIETADQEEYIHTLARIRDTENKKGSKK